MTPTEPDHTPDGRAGRPTSQAIWHTHGPAAPDTEVPGEIVLGQTLAARLLDLYTHRSDRIFDTTGDASLASAAGDAGRLYHDLTAPPPPDQPAVLALTGWPDAGHLDHVICCLALDGVLMVHARGHYLRIPRALTASIIRHGLSEFQRICAPTDTRDGLPDRFTYQTPTELPEVEHGYGAGHTHHDLWVFAWEGRDDGDPATRPAEPRDLPAMSPAVPTTSTAVRAVRPRLARILARHARPVAPVSPGVPWPCRRPGRWCCDAC